MSLNDLLANSQAYPCSRIFLSIVQPLKYYEYSIRILWINTDTVVTERKEPIPVTWFGGDMDQWGSVLPEFQRVIDEVLE